MCHFACKKVQLFPRRYKKGPEFPIIFITKGPKQFFSERKKRPNVKFLCTRRSKFLHGCTKTVPKCLLFCEKVRYTPFFSRKRDQMCNVACQKVQIVSRPLKKGPELPISIKKGPEYSLLVNEKDKKFCHFGT